MALSRPSLAPAGPVLVAAVEGLAEDVVLVVFPPVQPPIARPMTARAIGASRRVFTAPPLRPCPYHRARGSFRLWYPIRPQSIHGGRTTRGRCPSRPRATSPRPGQAGPATPVGGHRDTGCSGSRCRAVPARPGPAPVTGAAARPGTASGVPRSRYPPWSCRDVPARTAPPGRGTPRTPVPPDARRPP